MDVWIGLISNLGLPVVIVLAMGVGAWRTLAWLAREIVLPARDHLLVRVDSFFVNMERLLSKMNDSVDLMDSHLQNQAIVLRVIQDKASFSAETMKVLIEQFNVDHDNLRRIEKKAEEAIVRLTNELQVRVAAASTPQTPS